MFEYKPKKFFFRDGSEMNQQEAEILYNTALESFKGTVGCVNLWNRIPQDPMDKLAYWASIKGMKYLFEFPEWTWRDSMYHKRSTYMRILFHAFRDATKDATVSYDKFFNKINELREERRKLMSPWDIEVRLTEKLTCSFCLFVRRGFSIEKCKDLTHLVEAWLDSGELKGLTPKLSAGGGDRERTLGQILLGDSCYSFIKGLAQSLNKHNPFAHHISPRDNKTDYEFWRTMNQRNIISDYSLAVMLLKYVGRECWRRSIDSFVRNLAGY